MSYQLLQEIWFVLIIVLFVGYALLDGFDLGVGFWHFFAKDLATKKRYLNAIAPVWDGNEVWILAAGGAMFAAFPPIYATLFSAFYLPLLLVLCGLILRAVAIEFRSKLEEESWQKGWDFVFSFASTLPAFLYGVAVGNIVYGLKIDGAGNYIGTFLDMLNPYSLLFGLMGLFLAAMHGGLYLLIKMPEDHQESLFKKVNISRIIYLLLFLIVVTYTIKSPTRPLLSYTKVLLMISLICTVIVNWMMRKNKFVHAFIASSASIIFGSVSIATYIFPNAVLSSNWADWNITIYNGSSSENTLTAMLIIALIGMPLVLTYTFFIYRTFRGKVD